MPSKGQHEPLAETVVKIKRERSVSINNDDFLSLNVNSTSSDSEDDKETDDDNGNNTADISARDEIIISESASEDSSSSDIDFDEKIKKNENDIMEVDSYIGKLQERRRQLIADSNKLKERKALRRSNHLAKQNWENDTFPWNAEIRLTLKNVFKLNSFRPQQLKTINALMSKHDVLLLAPTGGGKSLCYQLPAVVNQGVTVVISPLISLMEDQVWAMKNLGIEADLLSAKTDRNRSNAILKMLSDSTDACVLKLLYVTPERLAKSKRFLAALQKSYFSKKLNLIAIDEVHCCSQWGHDFRPDYKFLGTLKQMFPNVPLLGVTATATTKVIIDVQKMLSIQECLVLKAPFNRPNLFYHVMDKPSEKTEVLRVLTDLLKNRYSGKSGIIYTFSIKDSEDLAAELVLKGIKASSYHASLSDDRRTSVHMKWLKGLIQVVVATVAFGMGIDKPDVRFVIHHTMSKSMENFYQESGRAGRDGERAECILLYRFIDLGRITTMMFSERTGLQNAYAMLDYCIDATRCRRDIISKYFSEVWNDNDCNKMCDHCYNTETVRVPKQDITNYIFDLHKIIDGAHTLDVKLTATKLIDAWYKKGPSNIRLDDVEPPPLERYYAEQIVAFLLTEKYLKEDFHFTAFSTISYLRKGPNVPRKDELILFHGARVLKLPKIDNILDAQNASPKSNKKHKKRHDSREKANVSTSERGQKRKCDSDTNSKDKSRRKSDPTSSTSKCDQVSDSTPKKSSKKSSKVTKERTPAVSDIIEVARKQKELQDRERIIKSNKSITDTTDDVVLVEDDGNVIEIDD